MSNFHGPVRALAGAALGSLACCSRPPAASPFSVAETNQALAPVKQLRQRCYESSALARAGQRIALDFRLEIASSGSVHAIPTFAKPDDPETIECVRRELNALRFPARGHDRLLLHFEMGR